MAREPKSIFGERRFFFFSLKTRKPQGKIGNSGAKGGLFLIWPGLPPVLPRQRHNHSTTGKECGSDEGRRSVFPCESAAKTTGLHLGPLSLSNQPNLLPITRPSAVGFQTPLCFHFASLPLLTFVPNFVRDLITAFNALRLVVRPFPSVIVTPRGQW